MNPELEELDDELELDDEFEYDVGERERDIRDFFFFGLSSFFGVLVYTLFLFYLLSC